MDAFTDHWYGELQMRLADQYQLTHDITSEDIAAFQEHHSTELVSAYENGQVLLKVIRRKFGNLVLKVVYQDPQQASQTIKQLSDR